jgi:sugar phosphate isomerase/epimerase
LIFQIKSLTFRTQFLFSQIIISTMKSCLLLALCLVLSPILQSNAQSKLPPLGICASYENDSLVHATGLQYLEESVRKMLAPAVSDSLFNARLPILRHSATKIESCNLFFPGEMKLVGPEVNEKRVLGYVDSVMQRAKIAGIRLIVLGSGGARKIPEGVDRKAAKKSFIVLVRKMAVIAAKYDCVIAMENLNSSETNFVNTLAEGYEIAKAVHHPNFRLTVDIYHMLRENESPASIENAKGYVVHCHIAEKEKRTAPGVMGDDFRPYFRALKKINYPGRVMMECRWEKMANELQAATTNLQQQLEEAYR